MIEDINKICDQVLRQLSSPMKRRYDSNLIVIQSQIETIKLNNLESSEKIKICTQILRQLDLPMRRQDDWNLEVVKEHIVLLKQKLNMINDASNLD